MPGPAHFKPIMDELRERWALQDPDNDYHQAQDPSPAPVRRTATGKRGGRRPGAGAPKGNLNALKSGRYSRTFKNAAIYMHAVPDLRRLWQALEAEDDYRRRKKYYAALLQAYGIGDEDEELLVSIRRLLHDRLEKLLRQMDAREGQTPVSDHFLKSILQSNED